jgi:site-specific DNA recombinase
MDKTRIAWYARVCSQVPADQAAIQSQVAALEQRIATDGFRVDPERRFLDVGRSGATLQRPALERMRDLIRRGGIEQLYVPSPDRLARNVAQLAVLREEFATCHVEVVFLNQPICSAGSSPVLARGAERHG